MKTALIGLFLCLFTLPSVSGQSGIQAWYAQGQVWVIWNVNQNPAPVTFEIYKADFLFSDVNQADRVGKLFELEYFAGALAEQVAPSATYTIPTLGGGTYTLGPNEALFVETVEHTGASFYAVVEQGASSVVPDVNITAQAVSHLYDPVNDQVNCHLQHTEYLPEGNKVNWYCMWSLGKQNVNSGRPDFPVTANFNKNGMPNLFVVSESINFDTTSAVPSTHWFHGKGGKARQYLANEADYFNLQPMNGLLVAHNDDMVRQTQGNIPKAEVTFWYGWCDEYDPFTANYTPGPQDLIYNYTQLRVRWINDWLIRNYSVDPQRVSLQGYSMGSAGALGMAKVYPELFAAVSIFNHHFAPRYNRQIFGPQGSSQLNIQGPGGDPLFIANLWDLYSPASATQRDLPLMNVWCGVNDPQPQSQNQATWDRVILNYSNSDKVGYGMQLFWDQRNHSYIDLGFEWILDLDDQNQTIHDNLSHQQQFRSDESFPAFFNHAADPNTPSLEQEDWGTWGGWHTWDPTTLDDQSSHWEITAWLDQYEAFDTDNCPFDSLSTGMMIRRPQYFLPTTNTELIWSVREASGNQAILQQGITFVEPNDLVMIPELTIYSETIRKVIIRLEYPPSDGPADLGNNTTTPMLKVAPNPSSDFIQIKYLNPEQQACRVMVYDSFGRSVYQSEVRRDFIQERLDVQQWPSGMYFIVIEEGKQRVYQEKVLIF
jgi:pimeloyl-ACP methyl ester carboxylesterase